MRNFWEELSNDPPLKGIFIVVVLVGLYLAGQILRWIV